MKGIVFNLLEDFIVEGWGDETYEDILDLCPLHTQEPFVGPGTYPDADLFTIATKAADTLGLPLSDALRAFGKFCFPRFVQLYPIFLEGHSHPRTFLESIDGVIHVEVRKLMKEATPPRFEYVDLGPKGLGMHYHSERGLCSLVEGLIDGCAEHFGEHLTHHQAKCTHKGDEFCAFELVFANEVRRAA